MAASAALLLAGLLRISCAVDDTSVTLAAADLAADCGRVLGTPAQVVASGRAEISLTLDRSLPGAEAWRVAVTPEGVRITGSDRLGLVHGIYQFGERCLGVDPLWFWKNVLPERRDR